MAASVSQRSFVPHEFDPSDFNQIQPLYVLLLATAINTPDALRKWLGNASELTSVIDEYGKRRYIEKSCHTDDPAIEKAFLQFVEEIEPRLKPLYFEMQKKFLASPARTELGDAKFEILARKWAADVELFRDENVPLETELTKLNSEYDKLSGAMMVPFNGKEFTLQQMQKFIEEPDREMRRQAYDIVAQRRLRDAEVMNDIFDRQLVIRQQIAANAGMADYRDYTFKALRRFDYTADDCLQFSEAIAETCVPAAAQLDRQRQKDLGLDTLKPWDLSVDPQNRPALRPFDEHRIDEFVQKTTEIFARMSPKLADDFASLATHGNLDLESRKGKQPGGYQESLDESKQPFVFMNSAGLQRDVETLLHEGGHAFHFLATCRHEPLVFLRSAPIEFCEVASMTMELLGAEHLDIFYSNPIDAARAKRSLLEGIIQFLPWMATVDSFQQWLYTHPGHSRAERTAYWLGLVERFGRQADWTGHEAFREILWQRQVHFFHVPFYYVEYGIAQLGALQLWLQAKTDPQRALNNYQNALKLGGTRSLPDLFRAANIHFDFSQKTLLPLIQAISEELAGLPQ